MSRLLGLISNDPHALCCALDFLAPDLELQLTPRRDAWGIGYYQQGRALLQKRPTVAAPDADLVVELRERSSDLIVAHVQALGEVTARLETTQPFRYHRFLFAQIGDLPTVRARRKQITAQIPDFLARACRGDTDAELLFFTLLGVLRTEIGDLDQATISGEALRNALRAAVAEIAAPADPAGAPTPATGLLLTDGERLVASSHGECPLAYRLVENVPSCPRCRAAGRPEVQHHLRFTAVSSSVREGAAGWRELKSGHSLVVERDMGIEIGAL